MSKAYILLGRIACGKSHVAQQIAKEKGGVILSCDEIIQSLFDECLGEKLVPTEAKAIDYLLSLAEQIGKCGGNVIFDCGLFSAKLRQYVSTKLSLMGFECERLLIKCDEQIRHQRLNRRNLQRAGSGRKAYILPYEKVLTIEENRYEEPRQSEYDTLIENN